MARRSLAHISSDIDRLVMSKSFTDCTLSLEDGTTIETYLALIRARCPGLLSVEKLPLKREIADLLLRFVYTGKMSWDGPRLIVTKERLYLMIWPKVSLLG